MWNLGVVVGLIKDKGYHSSEVKISMDTCPHRNTMYHGIVLTFFKTGEVKLFPNSSPCIVFHP
jgi:hypothetical protein